MADLLLRARARVLVRALARACWLLLALIGCATQSVQAPRGAWYEARTQHFSLLTRGDPAVARGLAIDLEHFHTVLRQKLEVEEREAAPPLRIYLADARTTAAALSHGPHALLGAFAASMRGNYAVLNGERSDQSNLKLPTNRAILFHEYTHYMLASAGLRVPSWYNEGFAEYMSTAEFLVNGSYNIGCPPLYRMAWNGSSTWIPIERVLAADDVGALVESRREWNDAYAQSWYAVHYFNTDSARQAQLAQYLKLSAADVFQADAVRRAFGLDFAGLDRVLRAHAGEKAFRCVAIYPKQKLVDAAVELRPLSPADGQRAAGEILLATEGPTPEAVTMLRQAAVAAPNDLQSSLSVARALWMTADHDDAQADKALAEAETLLQQARTRASASAELLAIEGHVQRIKAARAQRAKQPFAELLSASRKAYRSAIRADETLSEAYVGLGLTYLIEDSGSQEAQVALEAAAYLLPLDSEVALTLAEIHVGRQHYLEAIPALEYALRWSRDERQSAAAKATLDSMRAAGAAQPAVPAPAVPAPAVAPPAVAPSAVAPPVVPAPAMAPPAVAPPASAPVVPAPVVPAAAPATPAATAPGAATTPARVVPPPAPPVATQSSPR